MQFISISFVFLFIFQSLPALSAAKKPTAEDDAKSPLVYLKHIDPSILQDMRYAGDYNFTGAKVPGYEAPECMLLLPVAKALARVQTELQPRKLSLKVYDCYRPERATRAFVAWAARPDDGARKYLYPRLPKTSLFDRGYIATRSGHSKGGSIDLTIVDIKAAGGVAPFQPAVKYGACTGPASSRPPDSSLDMGTSFDCFDALSHTKAPGLTPGQQAARRLLVEAMARQGFKNYAREWWHFTHQSTTAGSYDLPITAPPR
jgi:zinc D-Ala-D-Ala dipeptidase